MSPLDDGKVSPDAKIARFEARRKIAVHRDRPVVPPSSLSFVDIGARSNFSFLEGASSPEEMVEQAARMGLSGLGLADRNTVAGVVRAHAHVKGFERRREDAFAVLEEQASILRPGAAPEPGRAERRAEDDGTASAVQTIPDEPMAGQAGAASEPAAPEKTEAEIKREADRIAKARRDVVLPERFIFRPGTRLVFRDGTPEILAFPINRDAWGRLCRLLSQGNLRAEKGSCLLDEADLLEWGEGILLAVLPDAGFHHGPAAAPPETGSAAAGDGMVAEGAEQGTVTEEPQDRLLALLVRLSRRFPGQVHLALSPAYDGEDAFRSAFLAAIAEKAGVPLIATNQPLYHHPERRSLADVVTAIREGIPVMEAGFRLAAHAERFLKDGREMARLLRAFPQAVDNASKFFSRLTFSLDEISHNYPDESQPGETLFETLKRLTYEGADRRYPQGMSERTKRQIEHELDLIQKLHYEGYFLTVHGIVQHARHKLKILCQGRGSAANSTVCYCLEITEVNPEERSLLFERFISTARDEPPDIDVDFEHARREEVIQSIYQRYGREHAGLTAAVTSYRARSAGREVAKAFGLPADIQAALSNAVGGWWTEAVKTGDARLAGLNTEDPAIRSVLYHAACLAGFPRHLTQHVGGFVITRDRLDEIVPIMNTAMPDRFMIEWDKDDLDQVSLFKIDILALGMLTCMAKAFRLLEDRYAERQSLAKLCMTREQAVYDMICRADTIGVFQIESRAQMSMLPRLRPQKFYDLVIEVAIVRPGPIQGNMVHPYLKRREMLNRGETIVYEDSKLKNALERTLGIPLFQEQAMQIAIDAAGFTPEKADRLRRSMATFKRSGEVAGFRDEMIEGMVKNGYDADFAARCFSQIEGFGEYGFPESHAASFALLVYASCWVKTYYPDVFLTALLNSQPMGFYAPAQLVRDACEHGVEVRPVDVNFSKWETVLEEGRWRRDLLHSRHRSMDGVICTGHAVRLGFHQVKGLSEDRIALLLAQRVTPYRTVRDLWLRTRLAPSELEHLADADAFASMGLSRREAVWAVRGLEREGPVDALPLFDHAAKMPGDLVAEPSVSLPAMAPGEEVIEDYRALQLSLKAHPVAFLRSRLREKGAVPAMRLAELAHGSDVTVSGLVLVRQRPGSAKGVIFMTVEDETASANVIVWTDVYGRFRREVLGARLVKVSGRLQRQNEVIHIVARHLEDLTPLLGLLQAETRRFGVSPRADETLSGSGDPRAKKAAIEAEREAMKRRLAASQAEPIAAVMPKGRNFH
ncbi:error-prone DNA polymerase [Xaviernesmea oryzae]|uniref:Error-prone DNA polymerase n=1 Tax=Xaviernesmea oryzae TaxID=464029 RepID=A0A1Q9AY56_9HYPH|nr:error-prone DNA polymerase [Xaviernesmea oryzae]OLP60374.1 error-prone DNA polymerase [Xaviernesmea oryzae]SEK20990.1 error-prone DNA polymerase [Xaviernesmea oryzae]